MNESKEDVAAALFVFMGWLTTREEHVSFGADLNAAPAAELVGEFCKWNGIRDPDMAATHYTHPQ